VPTQILPERAFTGHFQLYRRALTEFRGAMLFIWGENDPAYSLQPSEELISTLDRPELHRLAKAAHFPMLDQPHMVTSLLKELLED